MAILKSGILGKFSGSVANVTGYNLGGQQVMRKKSVDVKNPKTTNQLAQRDNMLYAIEIYKVLRPLLEITFKNRAKKQTVLSEFLRLNLNQAIIGNTVDLDKLIVAKTPEEQHLFTRTHQVAIAAITSGTII